MSEQAIKAAREALGDPGDMTVEAQHDAILQALYRTLELAQLAGFRCDAAALAASDAALAFAANLSMATRQEIAQALRRCADEIAEIEDGTTPCIN